MYTLNLVFDLRRNDGLFGGDDPTPGSPLALRKSLNWLELNGNPTVDPTLPPPNKFDPETASWTDLGQAATLLLPGNPDPGWICLRAVHDQRGPAPAAGDTLQLVVSFGRPARFRQPQASPFTHDGSPTGRIVTTFAFGPQGKNTSRGWFFPLGQIAKRPGHPKLSHRYEFSVGLIVTWGGQKFYYGEDPEMDIAL
jgi:hypothetical protein